MKLIQHGYSGEELDTLLVKLASHGFWDERKSVERFDDAVEDAVEDFQATALGPSKDPLGIDGIVGDATWWALDHYTGADQKLDLQDDRIPDGLTDLRRDIIAEYLKLADGRCREIPPGSNRGPLVDRLLPDWWLTKYGSDAPLVKGPPWCMFTYSTCYFRASGEWLTGRMQGSCHKVATMAREQGIFVPMGPDVIAVPGDLALILRGNGTGHAMCVYRVNDDGSMINTIEGNVSNRVGIRLRKRGTLAGLVRADSSMCGGFERGLVTAKSAGGEGTR